MRGRGTRGALLALAGVCAVLAAPGAGAQPAPNAATSAWMTVTRFDNPLGSSVGLYFQGVALSGDGNTALMKDTTLGPNGTNTANDCGERVYEYDRVGGQWMTSPAYMFSAPNAASAAPGTCLGYGGSVALSSDGDTVAIAESNYFPDSLSNLAAVYVYTRTDHVWSAAPVGILRNPDGKDGDDFGDHVALSSDGTTVLVGAPGATVEGLPLAGEAYLYREDNGVWSSAPVASIVDPNAAAYESFGDGLLSSDGNALLEGGNGVTYLYAAQNGAWAPTPQPAHTFDYGVQRPLGYDDITSYLAPGAATVMYAQAEEQSQGPTCVVHPYYTQAGGAWTAAAPVMLRSPLTGANAQSTFCNPQAGRVDFSGNGKVLFIANPSQQNSDYDEDDVYTETNGTWSTAPVARLQNPAIVIGFPALFSSDGATALLSNAEGLMPGPVGTPPQYLGPGVAYVLETTDDWVQPASTPPPPPPPAKSGGGGFGGWTLAALGILFVIRRKGTGQTDYPV